MQLIFLKNIVATGACPITVSLDKIRFFKAGATNRAGKPGVIAYFTSQSFVTLASFDTQEEANAALERLEAEILARITRIKPYSVEFISAESWGKSDA